MTPFLERMCVLKHYRNFEIPRDVEIFKKWYQWKKKMLNHKAVIPTLSNKKLLIEYYKKYANCTVRNEHYDVYYKYNKPDWLF